MTGSIREGMLDIDTVIKSAKKIKRVVIVGEDVLRFGITAELCIQIVEKAFDSLACPPRKVAIANLPIPVFYTEQYVLLQPQDKSNVIGMILNLRKPVTIPQ